MIGGRLSQTTGKGVLARLQRPDLLGASFLSEHEPVDEHAENNADGGE